MLLNDTGDKAWAFSKIPILSNAVKNATMKISIVLNEVSNITGLDNKSVSVNQYCNLNKIKNAHRRIK